MYWTAALIPYKHLSRKEQNPPPRKNVDKVICFPRTICHTHETSNYFLPNVSTVIEILQKMTLIAHMESNAYATSCLVCGKPYGQVIEETIAHYLHQTAETEVSVRDKVLTCNAFLDGLHSGVFTFVPRLVSQGAAFDNPMYAVNFENPYSG